MKPYYDYIYLSPHLDDAVLSCAGQICQFVQAGRSVLIITIMAGDAPAADLSPFARSLHERWEVASGAVADIPLISTRAMPLTSGGSSR